MNTNGYAVICDARMGESLGIETLALVDRTRTKSLWWTSDDWRIAICYRDKRAADFAAKRLRRNRARVIRFCDAAEILAEQSERISNADAMREHEQGWDAHKGET